MQTDPATDRRIRAAARIRELRKAQLLTQEQLAAKAGVVVRTVQSFETGRNWPNRLTRRAIAEALGISVDDLEAAS